MISAYSVTLLSGLCLAARPGERGNTGTSRRRPDRRLDPDGLCARRRREAEGDRRGRQRRGERGGQPQRPRAPRRLGDRPEAGGRPLQRGAARPQGRQEDRDAPGGARRLPRQPRKDRQAAGGRDLGPPDLRHDHPRHRREAPGGEAVLEDRGRRRGVQPGGAGDHEETPRSWSTTCTRWRSGSAPRR